MPSSVATISITKVRGTTQQQTDDLLAVEEPLEIRLTYGPEDHRVEQNLAVTMRTPGHDEELVLGFLVSEGIVQHIADVLSIRYCENVKDEDERGNVIKVQLNPNCEFDPKSLERHFYTSSSCGVCGKTSIEAVHQSSCFIIPPKVPTFSSAVIHGMPDTLREAQAVFEYTGGLHAAGLFDRTGKLLFMREDIGRHNALDKLIGAALANKLLPLSTSMIQVSGRASFELVQKALMAGCPILSAVGAPSSLAVNLARSRGMTLLGFVRNNRFNVYSGDERML